MDFALDPVALEILAALRSANASMSHARRFSITRPAPRRPMRSATYHEADAAPRQSRRYSLATPPVLPPAPAKHGKTTLMDLPTEILDQIVAYTLPSSTSSHEPIVTITRKSSEPACTAADIDSGAVRTKWTVSAYPSALFLVNHTLSAIAFHRVWADCAVNISCTSADALCFLKYALSDRQRGAMRRVRFPKFMLSWQDPVGEDVWLADSRGAREPGFLAQLDQEQQQDHAEEAVEEEEEEGQPRPQRPGLSRMQSLVSHLQTRSSPALGLVC
ncbi:hypothetical protein MBLNU459_g3062t2 [Dothideomycetes sp. NU459]